MEKKLEIGYYHYSSIDEMPTADRVLVVEAEKALKKAYPKYSGFSVGAALLLEDGTVLHGANSESEVFPSGICAERSVLYYAEANYAHSPVVALAIASDPSERECYPCGACRQVILDVQRRQQKPIRLIMSGGGSATVVDNAEALLPFTFQL